MFYFEHFFSWINSLKLKNQLMLAVGAILLFFFVFMVTIISVNVLLISNSLYLDLMNNFDLLEVKQLKAFTDLAEFAITNNFRISGVSLGIIQEIVQNFKKNDSSLYSQDDIDYFYYQQNENYRKPNVFSSSSLGNATSNAYEAFNWINKLDSVSLSSQQMESLGKKLKSILYCNGIDNFLINDSTTADLNILCQTKAAEIMKLFVNVASTISPTPPTLSINFIQDTSHEISLVESGISISGSYNNYIESLLNQINELDMSLRVLALQFNGNNKVLNLEECRRMIFESDLTNFYDYSLYLKDCFYNSTDIMNEFIPAANFQKIFSNLVDSPELKDLDADVKRIKYFNTTKPYVKMNFRANKNSISQVYHDYNWTNTYFMLAFKDEGNTSNYIEYVMFSKAMSIFLISIIWCIFVSFVVILYVILNAKRIMFLIDKPLILIDEVILSISEPEKFKEKKNLLEEYISSDEEIYQEFVELISIILNMIQGKESSMHKASKSQEIKQFVEAQELQRDFYLIRMNNLIILESKLKEKLVSDSYYKQIQSLDVKALIKEPEIANAKFFVDFVEKQNKVLDMNQLKINRLNIIIKDLEDSQKLGKIDFPFDIKKKTTKVLQKRHQETAILKNKKLQKENADISSDDDSADKSCDELEKEKVPKKEGMIEMNNNNDIDAYASDESLSNDIEIHLYLPAAVEKFLIDERNPYYVYFDL